MAYIRWGRIVNSPSLTIAYIEGVSVDDWIFVSSSFLPIFGVILPKIPYLRDEPYYLYPDTLVDEVTISRQYQRQPSRHGSTTLVQFFQANTLRPGACNCWVPCIPPNVFAKPWFCWYTIFVPNWRNCHIVACKYDRSANSCATH